MTKLYIMDPEAVQFTLEDLDDFVKQFHERKSLEKLTLCKSIVEKWRLFAKSTGKVTIEVALPLRERAFPRGTPPGRSGVYAIFYRQNEGYQRACFYVGMTTRNVRERLRIHLGKDVKEKYAGTFNKLSKCSQLWLCTATVSDWQNGTAIKQKLRLLEACLTVHLRAWWYDL